MDPNKRDPTSCLLRQQATTSAYQISLIIDATRKVAIKKQFSSVVESPFDRRNSRGRFRDNNMSNSYSNRLISRIIVINRQTNTTLVATSRVKFTSLNTLRDAENLERLLDFATRLTFDLVI